MSAEKGTPAHRLEIAAGDRPGNDEIEVYAGDLIDCKDASAELRKVRPGDLVAVKVSHIRGLLKPRDTKKPEPDRPPK